MADPFQFERDAQYENSRGHYESFAAQYHSVRGDVQEAQDRLRASGENYSKAGRGYVDAARSRIERSLDPVAPGSGSERQSAAADYGFAASDYWYAGRAYADAYDFALAAEAMEAAAACYVEEARLREQEGQAQQASTLRVEASFRYLDAQRYFQQAADFRRNLSTNLTSVGELDAAADERARADELDSRALTAAAQVEKHGPDYHGRYQGTYTGADKSSYK